MKSFFWATSKRSAKKGDVVDVAEGYARNFLLPRNLASEANKGALAAHADQKRAVEKREAQTLADAKDLATKIESTQLDVKAKAGGNGKLFGAVTNADVANAITHELAVDVDKHKIEIKSQIKALGPTRWRSSSPNVVAKATINVVSA